MSYPRDPDFESWADRAKAVDILEAAKRLGAQLKRSGQEWAGPCPTDGGHDGFAVNIRKQVFICRRGGAGGDVVGMVRHVLGVDFVTACEHLTGETRPSGKREETDGERREREERLRHRREKADRHRVRQERRQQQRAASVREIAHQIWLSGRPIAGTLAERYLRDRGIDLDLGFPSLRFVDSLGYPQEGRPREEWETWPALICAVQGPDMRFRGIWRVYLSPSGGKAPVANAKLGLGEGTGGAVWFGKPASRINVCEGVETALAVRCILGGAEPVAAALSTAWLQNFIPPEGVTFTLIWPDGDTDKIRPHPRGGGERLLPSPGLTAAHALHTRLQAAGKPSAVQPTPMDGHDFLDRYLMTKGKAA